MLLRKFISHKHLIKNDSKKIYTEIIAQSRIKIFYMNAGVPDTLDGRFENIIVHLYFISNRLKSLSPKNLEILSTIIDLMFKDFDYNLREIGVGDLSVGKKIYQMTEAYKGRFSAYDLSLKKGKNELILALKRNLYGTVKDINNNNLERMANYFMEAFSHINKVNYKDLMNKNKCFLSPSEFFREN